jgi:hypothetical protein
MNLNLPTVTVTPGPVWANNINTALTVVDGHNHTAGSGVLIPTAGLNINADLSFAANNATNLRSVRLSNTGGVISGANDLACIYSSGGDLYWNSGAGIPVQLTIGGALNATSIGGIGGDYTTSGASVSYSSLNQTFTFWQSSGVSALMDMGTIKLHPIGSSFYTQIQANGSLSANYTVTLPVSLPASQKFMTLDASGNIGAPWEVDNSTLEISGGTTLQVKDSGITSTKLAPAVVNSFSFRNRIMNGDMRIDQRNNGAIQTSVVGTNTYTVDRWYVLSSGAAVTTQRVAGITTFPNAVQINGVASNTQTIFAQRIESFNSSDLVGSIVSGSVVLSGSASGSVTWSLGFPTTASDNYTGGTTVISSGTINFTTTPTRYTFVSTTLPSGAANGLQLSFEFGALVAGVTRTVTGVQLEPGNTATSFQRRPYGLELVLCQRYFQFYTNEMIGYAFAGTQVYSPFFLKVTMRATPSIASGAFYTVPVGNAGTPGIPNSGGSPSVQLASPNYVYFSNVGAAWNIPVIPRITGGLTAEL